MKNFIFLGLLISTSVFADCSPSRPGDPIIYENDFIWNMPLEKMKEIADTMYVSPKRLDLHAYKKQNGQYVIPLRLSGQVRLVQINQTFINSVRMHIEQALKRTYVDVINYSDMGHSHFFIPQKFYDDVVDKIPNDRREVLYEKVLAHTELKILYHTAEMLEMKTPDNEQVLPDRHTQWRFYTRNLIGDNKAQGTFELIHQADNRYNTAQDYQDGYRYYGAGFYISAHENGCFSYKYNGKKYGFDISLEGINERPQLQ